MGSPQLTYRVNNVFDIGFGVLGIILVLAVSRPGRRFHLHWAVPGAIGLFLTGLYRVLFDLRLALKWHISLYSILPVLYLSDAIGFVGCYRLWRLLQNSAPLWIRPGHKRRIPHLKVKSAGRRSRAKHAKRRPPAPLRSDPKTPPHTD